MSKILDATCNSSGVVKFLDTEVPSAEVLSEGKADSTGLLFLEGENARYLPSSATDIKETLDKVGSALESLSDALTEVAQALTTIKDIPPGSWSTPGITGNISQITAAVAEIDSTKAEVDTLKGALK